MPNHSEAEFIREALNLSIAGCGHTRPNPPVGAVIVRGGKIIGRGCHLKCGGEHAEVAAIRDCLSSPKGATLYVTLEPCSRPGRVGACTDAIIAAGIKRVVYAVPDPNPKNHGRAERVLARHGITCKLFRRDSKLSAECRSRIAPFHKHVLTGLPYVTVKIAMSLDGRICDDWGDSDWISSVDSRLRTNSLRSVYDAVMVGAETVRKDNPSLLARFESNPDLIRVVVSKSGKLPKKAYIFTDGKNPTLVFDDVGRALQELGKMGITSVLCEGGLKLATSLAEAGYVDEWITVLAPIIIGSRRIDQTVRGTAIASGCFLMSDDVFFNVRISEFGDWPFTAKNADSAGKPKRKSCSRG